jgi:hypothetical protein
MLSIGKLGRGQERYYLDKVAAGAEDYYAGEGEAEGYWLGEGAEILGLDGKVEPEQLGSLLAGDNPASGEPLGLKSASGREPVPGFDLTSKRSRCRLAPPWRSGAAQPFPFRRRFWANARSVPGALRTIGSWRPRRRRVECPTCCARSRCTSVATPSPRY